MVFPPLLRRYRYLFHELTQKFFGNTLKTISIGTEGNRRPLLYFKSVESLGQMSEEIGSEQDLVESPSISVSNVKKKSFGKNGKHFNKSNDRRGRRPDMKLYVPPKAKTSSADETEDQTYAQNLDQKTIESLSELEISDSCLTNDHNLCSDDSIDCNKTKDITETGHQNQKISDFKASNEEEVEESSWDSIFDENGDCVRPEFVDSVNDLICNKSCDDPFL